MAKEEAIEKDGTGKSLKLFPTPSFESVSRMATKFSASSPERCA
jgi:hypothetical protein